MENKTEEYIKVLEKLNKSKVSLIRNKYTLNKYNTIKDIYEKSLLKVTDETKKSIEKSLEDGKSIIATYKEVIKNTENDIKEYEQILTNHISRQEENYIALIDSIIEDQNENISNINHYIIYNSRINKSNKIDPKIYEYDDNNTPISKDTMTLKERSMFLINNINSNRGKIFDLKSKLIIELEILNIFENDPKYLEFKELIKKEETV